MLRKFGKVKQVIEIPEGVDVQKHFIEALYKNGLLKVKLKLKKKSEAKKTTIQVAYRHPKGDAGKDGKEGKDDKRDGKQDKSGDKPSDKGKDKQDD